MLKGVWSTKLALGKMGIITEGNVAVWRTELVSEEAAEGIELNLLEKMV